MTDQTPELIEQKIKTDEKIYKRFKASLGLALQGTIIAGGVTLATVATAGTLPLALGLGAAAVGTYGLYRNIKFYTQSTEQNQNEMLKMLFGKKNQDNPDLGYIFKKLIGMGVTGVVTGAVVLGAGLALYGVAGPLATTAAVIMVASGGVSTTLGTLATVGVGLLAGAVKIFAKPKDKTADQKTNAPAPSLDSKPANATAKAEFNAAAPVAPANDDAKKDQAPAVSAPKPPTAA